MKKILITIAAITMAIGPSFGGACGEPLPKETAWVYKWTFKGQTTTGEKIKQTIVSSPCGEFGDAVECAVRTPSSLKIEGYAALCSPGCGTESFLEFSESNEIFWQKKPFKASLAGGVTVEVANIIGGNKKKVEIGGTAAFDKFVNGVVQEGTYNLTYAGFGKYDLKNGRISSAKGTFAGFLSQPHAVNSSLCTTAGYWDCSTLSLVCEGQSVAFGTWKLKLKKTASKKYLNTGALPKTPSWYKPIGE